MSVEALEQRLCPSGDLLVLSFNSNTIVQYDGTTGAFLRTFASEGLSGPSGITLGPDKDIYVSNRDVSNVVRYDGETGAFLGSLVTSHSGGLFGPHGLVFGPDRTLYVNSGFNGMVMSYNGTTGAFLQAVVPQNSGGLIFPHGLALGPDGNLYVGDRNTNSVKRYNPTTGAFLGDFVTLGSGGLNITTDVAFGPDGKLYVNGFDSDAVLRYDGQTGAFLGVFASGGGLDGPQGLAFGPDGNLYVSSMNTNQVLRYNGQTGAFLDVFASGGGLNGPTYLLFQKTDTTTVVTSSADVALPGQEVTFTAVVSAIRPDAVPPTGTVTFAVDGVATADIALSNGQATFSTSLLSVGSHTVTVVYHGDRLFNSSTSADFTQMVAKANTTLAVVSSAKALNQGQTVTFTATVSSAVPSAGLPTGMVTFFLDGKAQPAVALVNGTASFITSQLAAGKHTVTASYDGDANFAGSTASLVTVTVNPKRREPLCQPSQRNNKPVIHHLDGWLKQLVASVVNCLKTNKTRFAAFWSACSRP